MTLRQHHEHCACGARRQRGEPLDQQQPRDEAITKRVCQPGPRVRKVTRQPPRGAAPSWPAWAGTRKLAIIAAENTKVAALSANAGPVPTTAMRPPTTDEARI